MIRVHQTDVVREVMEQDQPDLRISYWENARNYWNDVQTIIGGIEQPWRWICNMI